jgi:hypothetical protein
MSAPVATSAGPPWWHDPRARPLAAWGAVLIASGLAHIAVWVVLGGPWEGAVTWRKPILFGISGGLTSVSLGWVWACLPWRRGDVWLARATAWALVVEVALIDLQRWRGLASHFNRGTPLDSFLYDAMGGLILFVTVVVGDLTLRMFLRRDGLPADTLLAARAGLVFLLLSCLLGIWVGMHGERRMAAGLPPETFGAAGVTKFPHGAVIHALQWLPLVAWAAGLAGIGDRGRLRLVGWATAGTALVGGYAVVQTLAGRGRFDTVPATAAVLAAGTACLAVPAVVIAAAWLRRAAATSHR